MVYWFEYVINLSSSKFSIFVLVYSLWPDSCFKESISYRQLLKSLNNIRVKFTKLVSNYKAKSYRV